MAAEVTHPGSRQPKPQQKGWRRSAIGSGLAGGGDSLFVEEVVTGGFATLQGTPPIRAHKAALTGLTGLF